MAGRQMNRIERRLAKKRGSFEALCGLAADCNSRNRTDEAIELYQSAVELRPDSASARHALAVLLHSAGRDADALVHFRETIARHPDLPEPHNGLGVLLVWQGLFGEAIPYFQRALALKPDQLDARITLGFCFATRGQLVEALEQAEIVSSYAMQPSFPHYRLGVLLARCNCIDGARVCLEAYLAQDPDDREGARLVLAALGFAPMPARASSTQLDRLYARRAASWDHGAIASSGYGGARLVAEALERLLESETDLDILDAGCGTGLVGALVSRRARRLEGVDMSLPMLAKAEAKGVYHHLHHGDLVAYLRHREAGFDVVTCAATLIHFGDLREPFEAAATALRDGGLFLMTLFPNEQDDGAFAVGSLDGIGEGGCFAHGRSYVARIAAATGFSVVTIGTQVHEYMHGKPRVGLVVALRRDARASIIPSPAPAMAVPLEASACL
jgi:predicted TPR repeat methyltransferase